MSPLTLEKIKNAKGRVKIAEVKRSDTSVDVMEYHIQIEDNGTWRTVHVDREKTVCEQILRAANSRVILG